MVFFDDENHEIHSAHREYENTPKHQGSIAADAVAAAAALAASRTFVKHREAEGKPMAHEKAFEAVSALAAGFIAHEASTRGRDAFDEFKAKQQADNYLREEHERHGREGRTYY